MSEQIAKRFRIDDNAATGKEQSRHETVQRSHEKRKRPHAGKSGGKVDVRSFLPRASAVLASTAAAALMPTSNPNNEAQLTLENKNKPIQTKKPELPEIPKGADRWQPADDLLLTISVLQVNELKTVHALCKFSCKFTLAELETRWNALLYNEMVSSQSAAGIVGMHPEQRAAVHLRAPFSWAEEELLSDIGAARKPGLADFQQLLDKFADTFYPTRTASCLQKHWSLLKRFELLCDQLQLQPQRLNFSDAEAEPLSHAIEDPVLDAHINQELKLWDQQVKFKARLLEEENDNWLQLVNVPGGDLWLKPQFAEGAFALLRGQCMRFEMRKRLISFGRQSRHGEPIDLDLSIEGPASKISRFQGTIELGDDGLFTVSNFGKYAFFANGKPILAERKAHLSNNSVLEIFGITLIFYIHKELVEETCFGGSMCNT